MTFYPRRIHPFETTRCGAALPNLRLPLAPYVVNPLPRLVPLQPIHSPDTILRPGMSHSPLFKLLSYN